MAIVKAPNSTSNLDKNKKTIFLAGSIEMDTAINWQQKCEVELSDNYNILNPRRISWNSDWEQSIDNKNFKEQVMWELDSLELSDFIVLFFASNTKSPISLLEFGLFAKSNKLLVVCKEGFWRKGNVDIVCEKYNIKQYSSLDKSINKLKK